MRLSDSNTSFGGIGCDMVLPGANERLFSCYSNPFKVPVITSHSENLQLGNTKIERGSRHLVWVSTDLATPAGNFEIQSFDLGIIKNTRIIIIALSLLLVTTATFILLSNTQSPTLIEPVEQDLTPPVVEPARIVREAVNNFDLAELITVSVDPSGLIFMRGALNSDQNSRLDDLLAQMPENIAPNIINQTTRTDAGPDTPGITTVVLVPEPMVYSESGRGFRVGEVMDSGWTVETITLDGVTVSKGVKRLTINF